MSICKPARRIFTPPATLHAGPIRIPANASASSTGSWPSAKASPREPTCSGTKSASARCRSSGASTMTCRSIISVMPSAGTRSRSRATSRRRTACCAIAATAVYSPLLRSIAISTASRPSWRWSKPRRGERKSGESSSYLPPGRGRSVWVPEFSRSRAIFCQAAVLSAPSPLLLCLLLCRLLRAEVTLGTVKASRAACRRALLFIMAAEIKFAPYLVWGATNHAENLRCSTACNCNVCRVGRGEGAYGQAENPAVLPERAADKRDLRLRPGKNGVPEGNVVPRLREHLQAINQYNQHTGASGLLSLRPLRPTSPLADEFRKW